MFYLKDYQTFLASPSLEMSDKMTDLYQNSFI